MLWSIWTRHAPSDHGGNFSNVPERRNSAHTQQVHMSTSEILQRSVLSQSLPSVQLLQEYYGISLELDAGDDSQLRGLECVTAAQKHSGPRNALGVLPESMQQHTKQGNASSLQKKHSFSSGADMADAQVGKTDHALRVLQLQDDAIEATQKTDRQRLGEAQQSVGQVHTLSASNGAQPQTPTERPPADVPASHSEHTLVLMPPADSGTQNGCGTLPPAQGAAQVPPLAWVPDSMAMDTSTLRELSVVPSSQGLLPVSLKSPLPLTAARAKKARGVARPTGAAATRSPLLTRGSALPGQAQRPTKLHTPVGSGRQAAPQASAELKRGGAASVRGVQPFARKKLSFAAGAQHGSAGKAHVGRQAPDICKMGNLQAQRAGASMPSGVPAAAQLMHQQQVPRLASTRHATGASSDSDTPRVASARLPEPVQQVEAYNPLFDLHQESSREPSPPQQPATATAASSRGSGQVQAAAGLPDPPWADQAAAETTALALTQQAQAQKMDMAIAQVSTQAILHVRSAFCCTCLKASTQLSFGRLDGRLAWIGQHQGMAR